MRGQPSDQRSEALLVVRDFQVMLFMVPATKQTNVEGELRGRPMPMKCWYAGWGLVMAGRVWVWYSGPASLRGRLGYRIMRASSSPLMVFSMDVHVLEQVHTRTGMLSEL